MHSNRLSERFDAVLFDAAGTLIHPHPSVGAVYESVARERGYDADPDALERAFRIAWKERQPLRFGPSRQTSDARDKAWWRETVRRNFELAGLPPPTDACFEAVFARFGHGKSWRVFPDVSPTLARLREAGLSVAIVSNFDSRLEHICRGLGLTDLMRAVIYSAAVGYAKPARPIYEAALAAVRTSRERALFVGDSPEEDVAGPRRAGLAALLLDRSGASDRADAIGDLCELVEP
jgi:putative hydrolase of the HAD superfamily